MESARGSNPSPGPSPKGRGEQSADSGSPFLLREGGWGVRLLPVPRLRRSTRRTHRARGAVLSGVLAVVALNLGLGLAAEFRLRIRDPIYGDKFARLAQKPAPCVVGLGTSRLGFGMHSARIEERLREAGEPGSAFNFGVPASGPVTHLVYLRRMIADGRKPDRLLVELLPSMFADMPESIESHFFFGDRLTHSELAVVAQYGFPAEQVSAAWRGGTFTPWYGLRFQLLARVVPSWLPWHLRFDWSRGTDAGGWGTPLVDGVTPEQRATGDAHAAAEYGTALQYLVPGGHPANALRELLALCKEHRIPVKLLRMPEAKSFQKLMPPDSAARFDAFLASIGCDVIDARDWVADAHFTDGHHLLRPGAVAFSDRLTADVIRPWLRAEAP